MHAARRTARLLGRLTLALVVLGCGAYLLPSLMGYERYVITGGSMSGSIEKGSVIFTQARPVTDLKVGDVITYLPPADSGVGTLVTHRISEIEQDDAGRSVLRTKGDANASVDPWTFSLLADTQPVVAGSVPALGYPLMALADRGTRMLVIGVPAGAIALLALVELGRNIAGLSAGRRPADGTDGAPTALAPTPAPSS